MKLIATVAGAVMALAVALPTAADERDHGRGNRGIPPGHLPPPGECRVWYDGQPPGHQPPPTACASASREAYATGGRVIYGGDDRHHRDGWDGYGDVYGPYGGPSPYGRDDDYGVYGGVYGPHGGYGGQGGVYGGRPPGPYGRDRD